VYASFIPHLYLDPQVGEERALHDGVFGFSGKIGIEIKYVIVLYVLHRTTVAPDRWFSTGTRM
jgi:hypothetical protein